MTKPSGTATYSYDNCGRLTSVSGLYTRSFTWDYEDRMTSGTVYGTTATNYTYNGVGTRTAKSGPYGSRTYKRDGVGVTAPVLSDGIATMVPGISEKTSSGTSTVHTDRLGSMKAMSSSGSVTDTAEYDAFGNVLSRTGSSLTQKGFAASYGYQEDGESGLKLLGHRYYDPETGRFISRDPIRAGKNWYAYCKNNPLKAIDPSGLDDDTAFVLPYGMLLQIARLPVWLQNLILSSLGWTMAHFHELLEQGEAVLNAAENEGEAAIAETAPMLDQLPSVVPQIWKNLGNGILHEQDVAELLKDMGFNIIRRPKGFDTPYGWRFPDIAVLKPMCDDILFYVECKCGDAARSSMQVAKDMYNEAHGNRIPTFEWERLGQRRIALGGARSAESRGTLHD